MFQSTRRNVSRKLTLVCMSFLLPDFVLMCLFLVTINGYINFAQQELVGNEFLRPLEELMDDLPQHLQLARRSIGGHTQCAQQLSIVQQRIDAAFDRLMTVDRQYGKTLQFTEEGLAQRHREGCLAALVAQDWQHLKSQLGKLDEDACESQHWRLIARVRAMITHAGDTSNLILDPDLDSYYLMDVTLLALPQMQDRLGTVLLQGEEDLTTGKLTDAEHSQFKVSSAMLQSADLDRVLSSAGTALNEDQNFYDPSPSLQRRLPPALKEFKAAAKSFISLTSRLADSKSANVRPEEFLAAGAAARRASFDLWKVAVDELDGLLRTRISHYQRRRALSLLLAAMAFTAAILLAAFITRNISKPLERQKGELVRANESIQESERRARAIIEAAPDCVITMNGAGIILQFNQAAERTFGYTRDEAVGRAVADLIVPPRYREAHIAGLKQYFQTGTGPVLGKGVEINALRSDGSEFPIKIAVSVIEQQGDHIFIAFISDITHRKEAEDESKRLYDETQLLLTSISSVLIHLDSAGIVTAWNEAAESMFGIRAADALGRRCGSLPWGDAAISSRLEELAHRHGSERFPHVVIRCKDGAEKVLDLTVNPICSDGVCTGVLILGNDRTEQEQLEVSLRQAQQLESIGQLAAGIAHEINTPMQFVCDNIEYLSGCSDTLIEVIDCFDRNLAANHPEKLWAERCRELSEVIKKKEFGMLREQMPLAISESLEGARRVINIVRAMKEFSHPGQQEKSDVDLNEAIRSTVTITRNRWKYVADLDLDLDPNLPRVPCLPAEINQVLLNLVVNATDAVGDKVRSGEDTKGRIAIRSSREANSVLIEVSDTGCGIPNEIRNRIFDPFFTTKDVGKGTGQGLAICYNIVVKKHGGKIDFTSTLGLETVFRVRLPLPVALRTEGEPGPESAGDRFATLDVPAFDMPVEVGALCG
jgi:PAS domain S-box-containing protein